MPLPTQAESQGHMAFRCLQELWSQQWQQMRMTIRLIILTIIAGRWSNTGKCSWTLSRYVPARMRGPEKTWWTLIDRLQPSCKTWISVNSLKCMTSMVQRASQGLLKRLCVWLRQEKQHKQPEKTVKNQSHCCIWHLTTEKEKFTFLVAVLGKKQNKKKWVQLFPDFSSRKHDALSASEQHCSPSNGRDVF